MVDLKQLVIIFAWICVRVQGQMTHREVIVHLDLKGAPPQPTYFKQLLNIFVELGANGVLIEWEDMFPYEGELGKIKNGNAYSYNDALDILQHAESLGMSVIPLVQTVGHLEWILKTSNFEHLRENPNFPMVVCIGQQQALDLVLDAVNQVMALHSKIRAPYIHIGADEVYQMGECEADRQVLPIKYNNDTKRLVFDYTRRVAQNITLQYPKTKVIMWYDQFRDVNYTLIKEYELDLLVTPVVWKYTTDLDKDLPDSMWEGLARSFSSVWGGSAFKGADGPNTIWNRVKPYIQNNQQWYLQSLEHADLFSEFHGYFLTGWQRYDHFASLCELMPVSMASLAVNLKLVQNFVLTDLDQEIILRSLRCPFDTTMKQLIAGEDKCRFPGHKVRDSIRDFILTKKQYEDTFWVHRRESAYLQNSQMKLNASNPFYTDAMGNAYKKYIERLNIISDRLKISMNDLFYKDVFSEFMLDHVNPLYDDIQTRLNSVKAIKARNVYKARPWLRKRK